MVSHKIRVMIKSAEEGEVEVSSPSASRQTQQKKDTMTLFLSTFVNKVDAKGRLSVPATFRGALTSQASAGAFQGFAAFKSYKNPAIEACALSRMERMSASVDRLDLFSETQEDLASLLFADAHQIAFDGEGRTMLPEDLRIFAGITREAAFVGQGATFQIWEPSRFKEYQASALQRLRQRGVTLKLQPEAENHAD